jgi:diadenylate cyclase
VELGWVFDNLTPNAIIDILLVGLLFFGLSFFIRGTQGVALLRGVIFVLVGMILISSLFQLTALSWLLNNSLVVLLVAIPVIFQPELRRGLERLGRAGVLLSSRQPSESRRAKVIDDICQAAEKLSERRHGALIVLQRNSNLDEYVRTGILLDSDVSPQLFLTIFWPKTELHDGAAIIDNNGRIASAACVLPLSATRNLPNRKLGTRHRAALGMSEVSDAICIVVSEETGRISITDSGRMIPRLDSKRLKTILNALYGAESKAANSPGAWLREQVDAMRGYLGSGRKQA